MAETDNTPRLRSKSPWVILLVLVVAGCGKSQSGLTADDLLRRQRQRELEEISRPKSLDEKIASVRDLIDNGNIAMAERMLQPMLISDPKHPDILRLWARCQLSRGQTLDATETLDRIPTDDAETQSELLWTAAEWLSNDHLYDAAQQRLERMLDLPGDPTRVHRQLASILNNQGRRIEAGQHLKALAMLGSIREKELVAMVTYSRPFIDETLPKPDFGGQLHPAMLVQASLLLAERKLSSAIELTQQLRRSFPDSSAIAALEGRLYCDAHQEALLGDWIASLPEGIEGEPEYWATLGTWFQRQGRHHEAVRCFAEAVRRDPTDRFSYDRLQRSLHVLGEDELAARAQKRFMLLHETARLSKRFGKSRGTADQLNQMADLLTQLNRPWESLAWRQIALSTYGGSDAQWDQLRKARESLAAAKEEQADDFVLCGLDLNRWPLPSEEALASIAPSATDDQAGDVAADFQFELHDVAAAAGLDFRYDNGDRDPHDLSRLLHQLTGGGIGVIDYDLDGWPDLYLTQGGGDAFDPIGSKPNQLYRNLAGRKWNDVTVCTRTGDTGYGQGVEVADLNQDGFPDLLVANIGVNIAYLNKGDGTFASQPLPDGDQAGRWTSSIACGDLDGDQLPEIFEVNYVDDPEALVRRCTPQSSGNCNPRLFHAAYDRVWRIRPDGTVAPWDGCDQLAAKTGFGFAGLIADIDAEPGNELFIANDAGPNFYWVGSGTEASGDRRLVEGAHAHGCAVGHDGLDRGCMGLAWGDFDRDGTLDLHITNFWNEPSDIYLQRSTGLFVSAGSSMGVFVPSRETVGWGTVAIDLDRNGWLDLTVLNGHVRQDPKTNQPFEMKPQLFRGGPHGFALVDPQSLSDPYWSAAKLGRMMAMLDWNDDGKPDLITNHLDQPVALLENRTEGGRCLRVQLVGTHSERDAVGAIVTLEAGDQRWVGWQTGGDGLLCSHEAIVDFGVGAVREIDRLEVQWPSGTRQQFEQIPTDQQYLIIEDEPSVYRQSCK